MCVYYRLPSSGGYCASTLLEMSIDYNMDELLHMEYTLMIDGCISTWQATWPGACIEWSGVETVKSNNRYFQLMIFNILSRSIDIDGAWC